MSHELRTPLNAIGGYAELIALGLHGPVTDAQRQALDRIQQSQRRLLALINDILNFAKLEAGRVTFEPAPVRIDEVLREVTPMVAPQAAAKAIALDVALPPTAPAVVADREKLGQVILNLLSNAVKFTPAGGRIVVDVPTRADGRAPAADGAPPAVYLRVTDTGPGIALAQQAVIFDPFVQAHAGLARRREGTGLGLAIARDLMRGMGGELRVRSSLGEGARFTITLTASVEGA